jgi:hypothetical protein
MSRCLKHKFGPEIESQDEPVDSSPVNHSLSSENSEVADVDKFMEELIHEAQKHNWQSYLGFRMGNLRVRFSRTVPVPWHTVPAAGTTHM